ncbi:MAG: head decoration protein [Pseudomonadota bacterium]|nr:head decoration protein [Pseudomonadota bacterium]
MTIFYETIHDGAHLVAELPDWLSRKAATLGAGNLVAGTVLGLAAADSYDASSAAKAGGNTGNGTLTLDAANPVLAGAKIGVYTVRCIEADTDSGTFRVENPDGDVIGDVVVGATFADDIKFVIADGATDFIVGDGFDITVVAEATGEAYVQFDQDGTDGSEVAVAILFGAADATDAAVPCIVHYKGCAVNTRQITWPADITDSEKAVAIAQLADRGIVLR